MLFSLVSLVRIGPGDKESVFFVDGSDQEMPFAAAVSDKSNLKVAIQETTQVIADELGCVPDLTLVFVTHHHASEFATLAATVRERLGGGLVLGCTGETVIGGAREHEDGPAISLLSGVLSGADLLPFQLEFENTPDGVMCGGLPDDLTSATSETRAVLLLGEPFSSVPQSVLDLLADELPDIPVVGGMASGGNPGENRLFLNDREIDRGAIGVVIRGGPRIRTVVSQGCRPIGAPFVVTKAERNVVYEMGGSSPMQRLQELYHMLPPRDQKLVEGGVHIGIALNEYQETFHRGDFLILNVMGVDKKSGALKAGGTIRVGQTVQFQIRDGETADADLKRLLERHLSESPRLPAAGLLFSCNGRGTRMFSQPNHDASLIQAQLGPMPLVGIFAQGELGPVGGKNYIHGFTASLALFEEEMA
ncbi:FIST signal transduction protein [Schlesneria paludicola]|uniref:FIST signal transduction protein n=1 Tax=Schlesneria paludicola TaxID=360056 RepID=UPI00029A2429|nr:FIST N-terminal domain-containing protein [Schlesneria paludicola]